MGVEVNLAECKEIAPGIFQKNAKTFYIKCSVSGTICYCNDARLQKLVEKYGSIEAIGQKYVSREAKQLAKVVPAKVTPQPKEVKETKTISDREALIAAHKAMQLEIETKQNADNKRTAEVRERVIKLSAATQYKPRSASSPEELQALDVCWRPDYWAKNKFCDGCNYLAHNMCGCKTKEFKKKQKYS